MSVQIAAFDPQSITRRLYAAVSGPPGPRRMEEVADLFHPEARLVRTGVSAGGLPQHTVMSFEAYRENVSTLFATAGFLETEVSQQVFRFGLVASIHSIYAKRLVTGDRVEEGRGINLINLVCGEDGWKILSIVWDNEREGLSLPPSN